MHVRQYSGLCLLLLGFSGFHSTIHSEEPLPHVERLKSSPVLRTLKPNPLKRQPATPAEETLAQMHVPEGFRVELVAAEPDVRQPIAFAFDEKGRIWVAEAYCYPAKRPAGMGEDILAILEDRDLDGVFESRKVFAGGLNLVSGFEVGHGGVWVGAAPELLFIPDRDRDDRPDGPPEVLLDGFGFQDTHECLNSFLWGPDGWLYGIQGVFNLGWIGKPGAPKESRHELRAGVWRYHPVRHAFEIFAHGGSNPWGLDYDDRGQLFMTHCRSYWGRGLTTHVLQGGHFWNQANANYAPFIVANPPGEFPGFRNYLLASARYDHGAGGAGKPGSDAIYGGHSHVGTLLYLGDNWPDAYRGHLFTHNLHGHQINQQINRPLGSGFDTVHAGADVFFCSDPKYVAVDLQYGPDGAVYIIDWYDQQHCHNPNTERWDRGNGRIYRMQWDAAYAPRKVDLSVAPDLELVRLLDHKNRWHGRTAARLLRERAHERRIEAGALDVLKQHLAGDPDPGVRLRALWLAGDLGYLDEAAVLRALNDADEYVRGWAVQTCLDGREASPAVRDAIKRLASRDSSPVVHRYIASALPRLAGPDAWDCIERLAGHEADAEDRNLPFLIWHGLAPRMASDVNRGLSLADRIRLPQLADWIHWFAATLEGEALNRSVASLAGAEGDLLRRRLAGLWLAMSGRSGVPMPAAWRGLAPTLYSSTDPRIQRDAERLAAVFGDTTKFPELRRVLADASASREARKHAFDVLSRAPDADSLSIFITLLDDAGFRPQSIPLLARFDSPSVAPALLDRFDGWTTTERTAALNTLASRVRYAMSLLDAISAGRLGRDQVTAYQIRQLAQLNDAELNRRMAESWGAIKPGAADKKSAIDRLEKIYDEAPLWAYNSRAGREHFLKLCAQCHVLGNEGTRLGPELTGAGRNGIRYYLENIVDPNAVIGSDFQMATLETANGEVLSGLVESETPSAITLRTTASSVVIPKGSVVRRALGESSLMPEGLLESLGDREQLELLKFLLSN